MAFLTINYETWKLNSPPSTSLVSDDQTVVFSTSGGFLYIIKPLPWWPRW